MQLYTDYPFVELGDTPHEKAPVREVTVLNYDGDKYCDVIVEGVHSNIKVGYIYTEKGRHGKVPKVKLSNLNLIGGEM